MYIYIYIYICINGTSGSRHPCKVDVDTQTIV